MKAFLLRLARWPAGHRKITTAVLTAVVALLPDDLVDDDRRRQLVEVGMVLIAGLGAADWGKEKAKVEVAAASGSPDAGVVTATSERRTPRSLPVQPPGEGP